MLFKCARDLLTVIEIQTDFYTQYSYSFSLSFLRLPPSQLWSNIFVQFFCVFFFFLFVHFVYAILLFFGNLFERCATFSDVVELHFKNYLTVVTASVQYENKCCIFFFFSFFSFTSIFVCEVRAIKSTCKCNIFKLVILYNEKKNSPLLTFRCFHYKRFFIHYFAALLLHMHASKKK